MPRMQIPRKLEPFLRKKKRFKIAYGGRGGAKSNTFADIFLMKVQTERAKVGCFREIQNSIEDSVHSLLSEEVERLELAGFDVNKSSIAHEDGGEFRFKGLARNPDAIKSMHGFKYFWVEEAQSISNDSLKILTPTLRTDDSEIWFSLNLMSEKDPMSQRFIVPYQSELDRVGYYEDDLHLIVKINYSDNPWFPDVLEQERRFDFENLDRSLYDHIWLGMYNDQVEGSIIKPEWFDAAVDAHIKLGFEPRGQKVLTHDPSDSGDARAYVLRHGILIQDAQENTRDDINDACDWALDAAIANKVDVFRWDYTGVGTGLKRQVTDSLKGKNIKWDIFNGSEQCEDPDSTYDPVDDRGAYKNKKNKDIFKNRRAQNYWRLRDRFYLTYRAVTKKKYIDPDQLISISSEIDGLSKLRSEVCRIPLKNSGTGLIQIMDKAEMKAKLRIESPNLADSCMMSEANPMKAINDDFLKPLPQLKRGIV